MNYYSIKDVAGSNDRYKIFLLNCNPENVDSSIDFLRENNIPVLNLGNNIATFINTLDDYRYLNIDIYDFIIKLLEKNKAKIDKHGNDVLAVYNLGILLEPRLELNAVQLLKEFSKSSALIIIWENLVEFPGKLCWTTQQNNFLLDFSESPLKMLRYEI